MTEYTLIRSRRRTIALYIRAGTVEVRAPMHMSKRDIELFIASKKDWLRENLAVSISRKSKRDSFVLAYGSVILYRGQNFPIEVSENSAGFDGSRFCIPPGLSQEEIKSACTVILKSLAAQYLIEKTGYWAIRMSVSPAAIKISSAKTRWGSCSGKKNINFSWRLIMADDDAIDYVIVHELAHLTQMNHSAKFWEIIERVLPCWRESRSKLDALQKKLICEDWEI